jgi:DNA ligase-associated metallophosphoesterase
VEGITSSSTMKVSVFNEALMLLSDRAIFWETKKLLMVADLHLGKVNHFRKAGIAVPLKANDKNIETLISLILRVKPDRVIFLGDLFHSHYNNEWEVLRDLISNFLHVSFELVMGNHDILSAQQYARNKILIHTEALLEFPFLLSHHPLENFPSNQYNIVGHIHPGVQLVGKGKQAVTLPCFHFGERSGILPSFGAFTGLAKIKPKKNDQVYVIADNTIIKV